jgi:hypothetical protein
MPSGPGRSGQSIQDQRQLLSQRPRELGDVTIDSARRNTQLRCDVRTTQLITKPHPGDLTLPVREAGNHALDRSGGLVRRHLRLGLRWQDWPLTEGRRRDVQEAPRLDSRTPEMIEGVMPNCRIEVRPDIRLRPKPRPHAPQTPECLLHEILGSLSRPNKSGGVLPQGLGVTHELLLIRIRRISG